MKKNYLPMILAGQRASILCMLLFCMAALNWQPAWSQASGNPILPRVQADPEILFFNGKYYIYPTSEPPGNAQFHAWSSTDLTNWVDEGVVFDLNTQCPWGGYWGWAPSVVFRNNKYYFYYTAALKIGVAVGNSPIGPFTDLGAPLIDRVDDIDPFVFVDDDGQAYLYHSGNQGLQVRKLNTDMLSFSTGPTNLSPEHFTEGVHILKRNGIYYMSYSEGDWRYSTYQANYSTSTNPYGPWTYKGALLRNNGPFTGTGHHSIVKRPGCDEYYIAYHRYENGDYAAGRKVAIDRLYFDNAGNIMQVNQTWAGVPARPSAAGCLNSRPIDDGVYWIQSRMNTSTGEPLVMEITGCNQSAGANVATWTANTSCLNQRWQLTYSNNFYTIVSAEPNHLALDLGGCQHANGTNIGTWTQNGYDCQKWRIEASSQPGYFRIMSKQSGYVADVAWFSNVPGANIGVWTPFPQANQQWKFTATLPVATGGLNSAAQKTLQTDASPATSNIKIYPDPANNELTIAFPDETVRSDKQDYSKNVHIRLFNQAGALIRSFVKPISKTIRIDVKTVPNGHYFIQLTAGTQKVSKAILIRH